MWFFGVKPGSTVRLLQSGRGPAALSASSGPSGSSRGAAGGGAEAEAGAGLDGEPAAGSGARERAGSGAGSGSGADGAAAAAAAAEPPVELVVSSAFLHQTERNTDVTLNSATVLTIQRKILIFHREKLPQHKEHNI